VFQRHDTAIQRMKIPNLVYATTDKDAGEIKWGLVEITRPWPSENYHGETSEK
jgi:hypothetical protein